MAGTVSPKRLNSKEAEINSLNEAIKKADKKDKTSKTVSLPCKIKNNEIRWSSTNKSNIKAIVFIIILFSITLYFYQDKKLHESIERRNKELVIDYPEFVSKFTLLMGAGLSPKKTWEKIAKDNKKSNRYIYKEMQYTANEMNSGMGEKLCYEHFMKRINMKQYTKFITLLIQNIEKGSKGLIDSLDLECIESFKDRKTNAKLRGEEASTKLLLPMGLMLVVVLIIIIIPAFLQMGM